MIHRRRHQSGNMLIYILGAIVLMGVLVVLVKGSMQPGTGIDAENVELQVSRVQTYASALERAVNYILMSGNSEADIRFAYTGAAAAYGTVGDTPKRQVFEQAGGGLVYTAPPTGANDGTAWQFYGTTHITDMGTDTAGTRKAELIAVLPHVTLAFCNTVNQSVKQNIDLGTTAAPVVSDPGACVNAGAGSEFAGTFLSGAAANTLDDTKLSYKPAKEACVRCADNTLNYYRVLMGR